MIKQFELTRSHLEQWRLEMEQLTVGLKSSARIPASGPMDVYLMITYRNILNALLGLKAVMEHSLSIMPEAETAEPRGAAPLILIEALRDTIETLEKTKESFRSRELGELRHRLENLLMLTKEHQANSVV